MDFIPSVDLNIAEKLKDPAYRQEFFLAEASADIASQLIALRKLRALSQAVLGERIGTTQSGVSRIENSDYRKWSYSMLRRVVKVLDARLRIIIEPSEDVLHEYEEEAEPRPSALLEKLAAEPFGQNDSVTDRNRLKIVRPKNEANKRGAQPGSIFAKDASEQRSALRA